MDSVGVEETGGVDVTGEEGSATNSDVLDGKVASVDGDAEGVAMEESV